MIVFPPQPDPAYYYGFVYFRQVKDSDIRRGYFQKVHVHVCNVFALAFYLPFHTQNFYSERETGSYACCVLRLSLHVLVL